jgi:outer membrane protein OmpA-like peptidoglycan-associated protein
MFGMTNTRSLLQLSVVLSLALGTGACSTLADLDPTGLLSDDSTPAAPAGQFPDTAAPQASDAAQGTTPDLASLPSRPAATSAAQQQQTVQSLAADGAQVQYSADALRGGTEAAAPVPGAAPPPSTVALAAAPPAAPAQPPAANDAPPTTDAAPSAAPPSAAAPSAADEPPTASAPPPSRAGSNALAAVPAGSVASAPPPPVAAPAPAAAPMADVPPSAAAPSGASEPAVPANTPVRSAGAVMANATPSDTELGFRPSAAPPLDPSINQWVAAPIVSRYRETASNAGISTPTAIAAVPGPAVAANVGVSSGMTPTAVVYFPGDGTVLSAAARTQIRSAVQAFKASGGGGTIRVVGHSSSRTANMSIEKHLETIFDKSQKRANAVAQELIHEGVPAAKVLVEAVGDSQPVYYESMPKGEDGNRRAEIFVQG